jgi:abequosyltransferase
MNSINKKILTIAIPTYNRSDNLFHLLNQLYDEVGEYKDQITVIVSNNNSSDNTLNILNDFKIKWPELEISNQVKNIGPDLNFSYCYDLCNSKYFWLLGDDDLPTKGSIAIILALIKKNNCSIIYLNSSWKKNIYDNNHISSQKINYTVITDKSKFASIVNVWMGYISGCIINKFIIENNDKNFNSKKYTGTNLSQLSWVLSSLKFGNKFIVIKSKLILATRNNTGGYSAIDTFGINFPNILKSELYDFNKLLIDIILKKMLLNFYTSLTWKIVNDKSNKNNFLKSHDWILVNKNLDKYVEFNFLTKPAYFLPKKIGFFFVLLAKFFAFLK